MPWYCAHIIMQIRFKDGIDDVFPVWELVVLVQADSVSEGFEKAKARGKARGGDDGGAFEFEGRPATLAYSGVRKLIECECEDGDLLPRDGTEVSYSRFEMSNRDDVQRLAKGESVRLYYRE